MLSRQWLDLQIARMESGQLRTAVAAIKEKGVITGQRIERREIGASSEFDHLTDDELERALFERLKALGWAFDGAPLAISAGSANGGGGDEADEV